MYGMLSDMATPLTSKATYRTVVLLERSDKLKLQRLAAREQVSSAEVIRRFIRSGDEVLKNQPEEEIIEAALKMISQAAREANQSMERSMKKIDALHSQLSQRETS